MKNFVLHPTTEQVIEALLRHPAQAIVLAGPNGIGKGSLLQHVAEQLLDTPGVSLAENAKAVLYAGTDTIGIDDIRKVQHFVSLKPAQTGSSARVVAIEHAERLSLEAQNALLKLVEEPPAEMYFLFTTTSVNRLLPTIVSRVQVLSLTAPDAAQLTAYFAAQGHTEGAIQKALLLSGGLPGTMASLLAGDTEHPLLKAAEMARNLLRSSKFERLAQIDQLAKDREVATQVCEVLAQMASLSLRRSGMSREQRQRWQSVLTQSLATADLLRRNAQVKLALTAISLKV